MKMMSIFRALTESTIQDELSAFRSVFGGVLTKNSTGIPDRKILNSLVKRGVIVRGRLHNQVAYYVDDSVENPELTMDFLERIGEIDSQLYYTLKRRSK